MYRKGIFILFLSVLTILTGAIGLTEDYIQPKIGECLEYEVIVKSMVHGADQTIRIVEADVYLDRPVLKIQSVMDSVGMIKSITKYQEKEEIVLDLEGLYPWVIRREISDKDGLEIEEVIFDYSKGVAVRVYSENDGPEERTELEVQGYVQDGLSLQFYLRKNITLGNNEVFFYSNGKIKKISYQITEVLEPLKLECGEFQEYYRVHNSEQKITILISKTPERYPLAVEKIGKIGKIEAKLETIK
ncbi:MAG: DUF3108 domain-containing protein [Firmicutes bacterium]|nr:DUF3108 domain-containing protein [Bacillota bacterium]